MRSAAPALCCLIVLAGCGQGPQQDPARQRYVHNALEMRDYINDKPGSRLFSALFVHRTTVGNFRFVPRSCDGAADQSIGELTNEVATVTDYALGFIPVGRYETSCGGLHITRGRIRPAPPAGARSRTPEPTVPPPPPPPPPAA